MRLAVALLVPAILVGACSVADDTDPGSDSPDLVLHGGQVLTMDDDFTVADAVAVTDGKVVLVGSADEMLALAGPDTRVVDAAGRTVMPGVVEPHTHLMQEIAPARNAMLDGQTTLLSSGITTAGMPTVLRFQQPAFEALAAADELVVRTVLYLAWNDHCGEPQGGDWPFDQEFGVDLREPLSIGGVKVFADGGSCRAPAVSFEYLEAEPTQGPDLGWKGHGDLFVTADELASVVRRTDDAGGVVVVHAIGDVAIDTALDGYERAGTLTQPHRIDHNSFASLLHEKSRSRYARLGVRVAMQLMPWSDGCSQAPDAWHTLIPADSLARVEDWWSLLDVNPGLVAAWHGDGPWIPGNPLQQAYAMVTGGYANPDGSVCQPEQWAGRQTMSAEETLRLLTASAAEVMGVADTVGSLEPGMAADLLVLESDPLAADPEVGLARNRPLATVIAGEVVHCVDDGCQLFDGDS